MVGAPFCVLGGVGQVEGLFVFRDAFQDGGVYGFAGLGGSDVLVPMRTAPGLLIGLSRHLEM